MSLIKGLSLVPYFPSDLIQYVITSDMFIARLSFSCPHCGKSHSDSHFKDVHGNMYRAYIHGLYINKLEQVQPSVQPLWILFPSQDNHFRDDHGNH